jgi:hypothetical protein
MFADSLHFTAFRFEHLEADDTMRLQTPVLRALTNVASGFDMNVERLLQARATKALHDIIHLWLHPVKLSKERSIPAAFAREALLALSNMAAAAEPRLVHEVLQTCPIANLWFAVLQQNTDLRAVRETLWGLANASAQHDLAIAQQLVNAGDFRVPLFNLLILGTRDDACEFPSNQTELMFEIRDKAVDALHHLAMTLLPHGWLGASHVSTLENCVLPFVPRRSRIHVRCCALRDLILVNGPAVAREQALERLNDVAQEMQEMILE